MLLFRYGSNMSAEGLQAKVRKHAHRYAPVGCSLDVHPCGAGRLPDWRLTFDLYSRDQKGLVADIVRVPTPTRYGVCSTTSTSGYVSMTFTDSHSTPARFLAVCLDPWSLSDTAPRRRPPGSSQTRIEVSNC